MSQSNPFSKSKSRGWNTDAVLRDYRIGCLSRQCSITARNEVFSGKAKFGIFGDGKEVAQLAMAYAFQKGDFRSGYYRDQTLMFALDLLTPEQFFAQLYAHADLEYEPAFAGRSMTGHFATRLLDRNGNFLPQLDRYNSSADISPTGSQMPRLVGLAYASKLYRQMPELKTQSTRFSTDGNEVVFGTIGNASCAEGIFWESVNAVGVLQIPMLLSIWDDGFGISVPNAFQMTKGDISQILDGFRHRMGGRPGLDIYLAKGWDYPELCSTFLEAVVPVRENHSPAIIHVSELTQPFGHSTSGNHDRYKTEERLEWEQEHDCLRKMREWILEHRFATGPELDAIESAEKQRSLTARDTAWATFRAPIENERKTVIAMTETLAGKMTRNDSIERIKDLSDSLRSMELPLRRHIASTVSSVLLTSRDEPRNDVAELMEWKRNQEKINQQRYGSDLYSESEESALKVPVVPVRYATDPPILKGFEIIKTCLDAAFERIPNLIAMGEDVGLLGGVNQHWAHLQEKYGSSRITDTGIREATIVGQAIGMALRGLRPIAEIQYLDYFLYALQIISDDLANLRWRTHGGQKAPVIIRTAGHRLEGIWHSGSPMSGIINLIRGVYVCVPRNSTQTAGFYNTILRSDDAAVIIEVLNGFRKKEPLPENIGEFTLPLGVPEILRPGNDVTIVTYGACCEIAMEAAIILQDAGIDVEVIDVRTLLPFDIHGMIVDSVRKTNRVLFVDEDCPGGGTAYMMQEVIERQCAFQWLDVPPSTLSARAHRPAYGSDGDYFSKPNREQIVEASYGMMRDSSPDRFGPAFD